MKEKREFTGGCWNYRIGTKLFSYKKTFNKKNPELAKHEDQRLFSIIEVYYKSKEDAINGIPDGYAERGSFENWEDVKDLKCTLKLVKKALKKPIIDLDNFPKIWEENENKKI